MPDGKKKRLLVVSTINTADWGGSEELWSQAVERLSGVDRHYLGSFRRMPQQLSHLSQSGLSIHRLRFPTLSRLLARVGARMPFISRLRGFWLRLRIAAIRPDFVLVNLASHRDGEDLLPALAGVGLPYALLVQSASWIEWPSDAEHLRLAPAWTSARRVFCVSADNAAIIRAHFAVPSERIELVRNPCAATLGCVDLPYPSMADTVNIAAVGRVLFRQKGHDLLVRALADGGFPASESWMLHVYGRGENEQSLLRLAQQLGIGDRVVLHGHESDLTRIWAGAHALVLSSRQEGAALVNYEAMMCGRPVFTTPCNSEDVSHRCTGLVATDNDVTAVKNMLVEAWANRDRWRDWGLAGRQAATDSAARSSPLLAARLEALLDAT